MNIHSTDSLASCIGFKTEPTTQAHTMAEEEYDDEYDRPVKTGLISAHKVRPDDAPFIAANRMVEILRQVTANDVKWFTLNHFATLNMVFMLENEYGIETQTLPKLLGIEKSTCNRILHSFADEGRTRSGLGFIRIEKDTMDRRITRVFLTEKGRNLKALMSNAGTYDDNQQDLRGMLNALDATRLQSLQKAAVHLVADDITAGTPEVQDATIQVEGVAAKGHVGSASPVAIKMTVDAGEFTLKGSEVHFKAIKALDRAMKEAEAHWLVEGRQLIPTTVRYRSRDIRVDSPENIRTADGSKYEIIQTDGYWMLWDLQRGLSAHPVSIQRNLTTTELSAYMNDLVMQINNGAKLFSEIMQQAGGWLNKTQYNYVRNTMTHDFADTRTDIMKQLKATEQEMAEAGRRKERAMDEADHMKRVRDETATRGMQTPSTQMYEKQAYFAESHTAEQVRVKKLEEARQDELVQADSQQKILALQKQIEAIQQQLVQISGVALSKDED